MAKKTTIPAVLPPRKKKDSPLALVPGEAAAMGAIVPTGPGKVLSRDGDADAMVVKDGRDLLLTGHTYVTREGAIPADEIYFVSEVRPLGGGAWLGEADKVSWRDRVTGYECIMMRETEGGHLRGFVGVPPGHPLFGYEQDAIPADLGIDVHGGIDYSAICEEGPSPEPRWVPKGGVARQSRRVCHSPPVEMRRIETTHATAYRARDDAWWLGFSCNHLYDLIPGRRGRTPFLGTETGQVYRDDGYVIREILFLAAQLRAVEDGAPLPIRQGEGPPPIGLEPGED